MYRIKDFAATEFNGDNDSIKDPLHEYANPRYPSKSVLETGKKLLKRIGRHKGNRNNHVEFDII